MPKESALQLLESLNKYLADMRDKLNLEYDN